MKTPDYIQNRHWTTKLVWGYGLSLILINTILILLFPPGIAFQEYNVVYGRAIEQGVLNKCDTGITNTFEECWSDLDCRKFGENTICHITCWKCDDSYSTNEDSYLFKSFTGKEYKVIGELEKGWIGKIALKEDQVKHKGKILWEGQLSNLKYLNIVSLVHGINEESKSISDFGFTALWLNAYFFLYILAGFMVVDKVHVRLFTAFFGGIFISANYYVNFQLIEGSNIIVELITIIPFVIGAILPITIILAGITPAILKPKKPGKITTVLIIVITIPTVAAYCRPEYNDLGANCKTEDHVTLDSPWLILSTNSGIPTFIGIDEAKKIQYVKIIDENAGAEVEYQSWDPYLDISEIDTPYFIHYEIDKSLLEKMNGVYNLTLEYQEYQHTTPEFQFYIEIKEVDVQPSMENYYCGDTHYHSEYTDNAVEFGGQIDQTVTSGKTIGLNWTFVTDHSFDITDEKWQIQKDDITSESQDEFIIIQGEEVSCVNDIHEIKNLFGSNIYSHFLAYNANRSIPGGEWEDSIVGEIGYSCDALPLVVNSLNNYNGFGYVAHPLDGDEHGVRKGDYFRTYWREWDAPYTGLEVWNGWDDGDFGEVERGLAKFDDLLMKNHSRRIYVSAGSDAHGDFQEFGRVKTCCNMDSLSEENILDSLKNGRCFMTSSPMLVLTAETESQEYDTSTTINLMDGEEVTFNMEYISSPEFGVVDRLELRKNRGLLRSPSISGFSGNYSYSYSVTLNDVFFRSMLETTHDERAYTNPIWVNVTPALVNQELEIGVNVENDGESDSGSFIVQFYKGLKESGTLIGEQALTLAQGESRDVSVTYTPMETGMIEFYVYADPGDAVEEIDEGDNMASRKFDIEVKSSLPNPEAGTLIETFETYAVELTSQIANQLQEHVPDEYLPTLRGDIVDFTADTQARQYLVEFQYDDTNLPVPEDRLLLGHIRDDNSFEIFRDVIIDKAANKIRGYVPSLSAYMVLGEPLPDLNVSVDLLNSSLRERDLTEITVSLRNGGLASDENVSVGVYTVQDIPSLIHEENLTMLPEGGEHVFQLVLNTSGMDGYYGVMAAAQSDSEEYEYIDNIASQDLVVYPRSSLDVGFIGPGDSVESGKFFTVIANVTCLMEDGCEGVWVTLDPFGGDAT